MTSGGSNPVIFECARMSAIGAPLLLAPASAKHRSPLERALRPCMGKSQLLTQERALETRAPFDLRQPRRLHDSSYRLVFSLAGSSSKTRWRLARLLKAFTGERELGQQPRAVRSLGQRGAGLRGDYREPVKAQGGDARAGNRSGKVAYQGYLC
jgi:hypothetical protein